MSTTVNYLLNLFKNSQRRTTSYFFIVFFFTTLSGALRKWIFTDYATGNIIFAVQLIAPYILLFTEKFKIEKVFSNKLLAFFLIYIISAAFNPLQKTIYHGIVGIVLHFSFWFLLYYYIENKVFFNVKQLIIPLIIIAFIEIGLGFIQYGLPQRHFLNRYAAEQNVGNIIAEVGTAVRITGTFSFISGLGAYLLFHALFVWGLVVSNYRPAVTIALMFGGFIACLMNGSRGATYIYAGIMLVFIVFEARKTNISSFLGRLIIPFLVIYLIVLARGQIGIESRVSEAYDNFQVRRESLAESGEEKSRILWDYYALANFKGEHPYFGIGVGSTYQGAIVLWGGSEALQRHGYVESELERYVLEGGFFLLFLRALLTYFIVIRLSVPWYLKLIIAGLTVVTPITFNIFNIVYLFAGIVFVDQVYSNKQIA